jgi:TatD DNase family protein
MTFESARQLRHLACTLPLNALVLETDAPDIPPQWRYVTASRRAAGEPQAINSPAELPRIGAVLAALRGQTVDSVAQATTHNVRAVLPRLEALT